MQEEDLNDDLNMCTRNYNDRQDYNSESDAEHPWSSSRKAMHTHPWTNSFMSRIAQRVMATWLTIWWCNTTSWVLKNQNSPERRLMNMSLGCWHWRWYLIPRWDNWISPLRYIFSRGRIPMKPVSNWWHGKLEICIDMSPILSVWQASSSARNTTPRHTP
jgi:hypothetical protein